MKYTTIILFTIITFAISSCSIAKNDKSSIKQGVSGKVLWKQGNSMPSPGAIKPNNGSPIERTIQIYEVAKFSDAEGESPLFKNLRTKLVATVKSTADGYFQCKLPVGTYSIFTVEEGNQLFASLSNGQGEVASFEVRENEVTNYDIVVNYKAFY